MLARIDALVKEHQPGIVVIDSFKALRTFAADNADFRRFLHDLSGRFSVLAVSSLWVGEYEPNEATDSPEFAVADGVIGLETRRTAERSIRYLSVRKLRGSDFLAGDHVYRVTLRGLIVFPRLADVRDDVAYPAVGERVSTGIAALDDALEEGYWSGSTTLIAGPSGAGKTLMGLHFVFAGAAEGEPGVFVTLQENRAQLARVINRFGWSTDHPNVTIMDRSPVDLYVDELVYDLLDQSERVGARRLVIDSLNDLTVAAPDPMRLRELWHLSHATTTVLVAANAFAPPPVPWWGDGLPAARAAEPVAAAQPTPVKLDDVEPARLTASPTPAVFSLRRAAVVVAVLLVSLSLLMTGIVTRDESDGESTAAGAPVTAAHQTLASVTTATTTAAAAPAPRSVSPATAPATSALSTTPEATTTTAVVTTEPPAPTTAANVAPQTSSAPPASSPAPAPTVPDGSPVPVLAVFDGDRVVLEGAVPSQQVLEWAQTLAVANAKGTATITNRLTINPAVPPNVPVRAIELQSVRFPSGSTEILPDHAVELDRVANVMLAMPHVTTLVIGHADQVGSEETNLRLSLERAQAVVNYLVGRGVGVDRLSARGVGETDLLAEDLGDDALALNRRTEFIFYGILIPPA